MGKHILLASCAALFGLAAATSSRAQLIGGGAKTADADLAEITVTAQRRSENLQKVPIAITALSATTLANNNATSLNDVINLVPGLHFGETGYGESAIIVNIRGQGIFGGRNPSVGLYIDEVPLPQVGPSAPGAYVGGKGFFFDLENVQVLKGPQGTLFGRNTTGGAVLLQTRRPGDDFGGNIQASYGNYNDVQVEGGMDVPLVADKLALRVAGFLQKRDGYVKIVSTPDHPNGLDAENVDARNLRATLLWTPASGIENILVVDSYRNRSTGNQLIIDRLLPGSFVPFVLPKITAVIAAQNALGIRQAVPQSLTPVYNTDVFTLSNQTKIALGDNLTFRNIFGFDRQKTAYARSFDGSGLALYQNQSVGDSQWRNQFTDEAQLLGKSFGDRLDWTAGVFYYNLPTAGYDYAETLAFAGLFGPPTRAATDYSEESIAFYGQGSFDVTDRLRLTAGIRYTIDKARGIRRTLDAQSLCTHPAPPYDSNCKLDLHDSWKVPTWNVAVDYKASNDVLLYGTIRRGFRSGGYNLISTVDPSQFAYGRELITDYELGLKADWRLGDVPIRTNLAVFHDDFKDAQITENLAKSGGLLLGVVNGADAEFNGGEVEVTIKPARNFEISANGSYLHVKYKNFPAGATQAQINSVVQNEQYGRPEFTFGLSANYTLPIKTAGDLNLYASYSWTDETFTNTFSQYTRFPPYGLLNLNATLRGAFGSPIDVSVYMTNATKKVYRNYVIAEASLGYASYGYGEPRLYGIRLNYRFGDKAR